MAAAQFQDTRSMRMIKTITLIACLSLFHYFLMRAEGFSPQSALLDCASLFILVVLFVNLIAIVQRHYHSNVALNSSNLGTLLLFVAITLGTHYVLSPLYTFHFDQRAIFVKSMLYKGLFVSLVYIICLLLFWIDRQRIQAQRIQKFAIEKEREAIQIELNSLEQQFKPHFLFNSLNSINALTMTNPEEARRMVHLLSEFMRASVRTNHSELITLEEEINHLKKYTEIEMVRFGSRLNVDFTIDEAARALKLPALILQPLIENAIKYGLYGQTDTVTISIKASVENNALVVTVTNPFDEESQTSVKGTGYGLPSIEKKMMILFGQSNLLSIHTEDELFSVTLKIPQQ